LDLKKDKYFGTLLPQHDKTPKLIILSLGAGVQSSTMALMAAEGHIRPMPDCAIFADTGYEPPGVYEYLDWLEKQLPFPVYRVMKGNIRDDMVNSVDHGTRFPTAPFYTVNAETGKKGMLMRQCTNDYKIQPIRKKIRELLGVGYYKHVKKMYGWSNG
jgi:3'-phosphoadenosine 5'-phosphosulfate sulfotransferase (PAPS reductase)/FAD synthetase